MTELSLQQKKERERWYKLKDHPVQLAYVKDDKRFKVVPAGRRSGKTERFKRKLVKAAWLNPGRHFFAAAPTRDQVKKIFWNDLKTLCFQSALIKRPSESDLVVYLNNGAQIHLIGLDRPERMEGYPWAGGGVDEIANCKAEAWQTNIKPALDTVNPLDPDYRAWCDLIGVPEGLNHYYDLWEYATTSGDPEWGGYTWFSSDILPPDVIASAKRSMSLKQYKQEYEASFESATGRIYEDYGQRNLTSETIKPHEQLLWHHDFNYTPLSSGIAVRRQDKNDKRDCFLILDEIILTSAIARQSALEFCDKFKDHQNRRVLVFGDPAGRAGEKHGHASDYTEIEKVLLSNNWTFQRHVKAAAPAIRDRQNAVRAKIANAAGEVTLFVNPAKAPYAHKGLSTVSTKDGSSFLEDESDFQHITTAIGYAVDYIWPVRGKASTIGITGI